MKTTTKGLAAIGIAAALAFSACSTGNTGTTSAAPAGSGSAAASAPASSAGGQKYIAIISKGFQHQFWQAVKKGAEDEAAKQGVKVTFEGPASEKEVEAQITMLTNAIAKKPNAIAFAALDSKAAAGQLAQIKSQGIPLVAFDSGVDSDIPVTTASTDNKAAAAEGAKQMCKLVGTSGKVGVVVHDQTSKSGTDRRDGFLEGMKANCPGVTVLAPQYGDGDQAKSADIAKSIIAANPDLKGIFGSNEGSAIGVVKGVQESKKTGLVIVGFDSGKAQIDAINSGLMAGAITQNPVGMGAETVKAALKAINKETLPKTVDTGFYWYDKTNINDPKIQAVLYQ
ncbi:MAG TPA: ABC transporter substrate-binding protein [Propionibacteriaceae bacterium]|nr:ABC transporter substrate-binding protein [Propionibacteriaceae bacterium]